MPPSHTLHCFLICLICFALLQPLLRQINPKRWRSLKAKQDLEKEPVQGIEIKRQTSDGSILKFLIQCKTHVQYIYIFISTRLVKQCWTSRQFIELGDMAKTYIKTVFLSDDLLIITTINVTFIYLSSLQTDVCSWVTVVALNSSLWAENDKHLTNSKTFYTSEVHYRLYLLSFVYTTHEHYINIRFIRPVSSSIKWSFSIGSYPFDISSGLTVLMSAARREGKSEGTRGADHSFKVCVGNTELYICMFCVTNYLYLGCFHYLLTCK